MGVPCESTETPVSRLPLFGLPENRRGGFTLLELIAVLAIVAIIASLGAPSLQNVMNSSKVAAKHNALTDAIQLARSEAILRGIPVELCSSDNGEDCGGALTNGWIVREAVGTNTLIESYQRNSEGLLLTGSFTGVTFSPTGMASPTNGTVMTMAICVDGEGGRGRGFSLSIAGSLTQQDADC